MRKLMIGAAAIALTAATGAATAGAASAATAPAQHKPGHHPPGSGQPSAQDVTWMQANAQADLAEIALGKLALATSQDAGVRKVATVTMKDHESVPDQLGALAAEEGVQLPTAPSDAQQKVGRELSALTGAKFDLTWDNAEITGHRESVAQTVTEIRHGSDRAVTHFAWHYLSAAGMHLAMAERLHRQLTR